MMKPLLSLRRDKDIKTILKWVSLSSVQFSEIDSSE